MNRAKLLNFRIPTKLKHSFQDICTARHTAMTSVLNEFIHDYVKQNMITTQDQWEPIIMHSGCDYDDDASELL